jgi:hypothetical protein
MKILIANGVLILKIKKIFISINKCAGTSLREYLKENEYVVVNNNNISIQTIHNLLNKKFTFYSIIRNPTDRYKSGLNEFISMVENNIYIYIK